MSRKLQIGLLSPFFLPIPGYEEPASDLNLDLVLVTAQRIDWKRHEVDGLVYNGQAWVEQAVPLPRSLYNRYYGPKPKVASRLETVIGKDKVFNHVTHFDKWLVHQLLANSTLKKHLPQTCLYTPRRLAHYLKCFKRVILKPTSGQLGTKIYLIREEQDVFFLHHGTKSPIAHFYSIEKLLDKLESLVDRKYILQEYLPLASIDKRAFDIRFLVQKNGHGMWQISGTLSRVAMSYSYITNVSYAILRSEEALRQAFPGLELKPRLTELSIKAAKVVEMHLGSLGEISVDFGLDENGDIWIIELNAKPMKNTFAALEDSELSQVIYRQPLLYARYLATI